MDVYINDVATTSNIPIINVEKFYSKTISIKKIYKRKLLLSLFRISADM